mgnify:CR=1 FL=1
MFIVVLNQRRKCESEWKLCEPEITLIAENLIRLIRSDVGLHKWLTQESKLMLVMEVIYLKSDFYLRYCQRRSWIVCSLQRIGNDLS